MKRWLASAALCACSGAVYSPGDGGAADAGIVDRDVKPVNVYPDQPNEPRRPDPRDVGGYRRQ